MIVVQLLQNEEIVVILDFTVIDAETTGRSDKADDVTEISAIKYRNGKKIATFSSLVRAQNTILPFVVELTGINDEMLRGAPKINDVIIKLTDFIGDDVILGHDVDFDFKLVKEAYERVTNETLNNETVDTLKISKCLIKDSENHKLSTLCHYFGVDRTNGHRALYDCQQTAQVYLALVNEFKEDVYECL